jgi:hypothetical protein
MRWRKLATLGGRVELQDVIEVADVDADCGPGHEVLHVLLGFSERRFRRLAEEIGNEVGGVVLGTTEVLEALRKLAAQPGAATAIGQLAAAYADQIVDMQHRR